MAYNIPRVPEYYPYIDFDRDADYDQDFESLHSRWLSEQGITITHGRDQIRSFAPPRIASQEFAIDNEDKSYSPEWPGSPVYNMLRPGRNVYTEVRHGERAVYTKHEKWRGRIPWRGIGKYPLFTGILLNPTQNAVRGQRSVTFTAAGTIGNLRGRRITVGLQEGKRSDEIIHLILDAAGWPSNKRSVSVGDTYFRYWWAAESDAWEMLMQILGGEGAGSVIFEDYNGNFIFQNRNYRTNSTRSQNTQAVFYDTLGGPKVSWRSNRLWRNDAPYRGRRSGLIYTRISYDPAFDNIVNRCTINVNNRALGSTSVIWNHEDTIVLANDEIKYFTIRPSNPYKDAIPPVLNTDYLVISGAVSSVSLSPLSGSAAVLALGAGPAGANIVGLQVRAKPLNTTSQTTIVSNVSASESVTEFGERTLELSSWGEIDSNYAQSIVNSIVNRYQVQRPIIEVDIPNYDAEHMKMILSLKISDRITVVNEHLGINADLYIENISHKISSAGQLHYVTLGCEKVAETSGSLWDFGLWDSAVFGE